MRHRKKGRKLSRRPAHKRAMMANLAMSLFEHERIKTTTPKAKELRPFAEKLITLAKRGDLHSRRLAARIVQQPAILEKLFNDIAPRFSERPGGYLRIVQIGPRPGDNAPLAFIELVDAAEAEVEEYTEPTEDDGMVELEAPAEA